MFLRKPEQAVKIYDELLAHDIPRMQTIWIVAIANGLSVTSLEHPRCLKLILAFVNTNDNPNPVLISDEFKRTHVY